jgi:hypothetical protein
MVEGQTTQWTTEKGQKEKQRSTKQTRKAKVRETGTPLKPGVHSGATDGLAFQIYAGHVSG